MLNGVKHLGAQEDPCPASRYFVPQQDTVAVSQP